MALLSSAPWQGRSMTENRLYVEYPSRGPATPSISVSSEGW
jgi:hypothetical protein